jgi:hypothetical protein
MTLARSSGDLLQWSEEMVTRHSFEEHHYANQLTGRETEIINASKALVNAVNESAANARTNRNPLALGLSSPSIASRGAEKLWIRGSSCFVMIADIAGAIQFGRSGTG